MDVGTPELGRRHKLKVERGVGVVRIRSTTGTLLERLLFDGMITEEVYNVMDDLLADMFRYGHVRLKAQDLSGHRVRGGNAGQPWEDKACTLNDSLKRISRSLGGEVVDMLYTLLLASDEPLPRKLREKYSCDCHRIYLLIGK